MGTSPLDEAMERPRHLVRSLALALALALSSMPTHAQASKACVQTSRILFDCPVLRITETQGQVSQVHCCVRALAHNALYGADDNYDCSCDETASDGMRQPLWPLLPSQKRRLNMGRPNPKPATAQILK